MFAPHSYITYYRAEMTNFRLNLLSQDEIETIHESSIKILETAGIRTMSHKALDILRDAGAKVDYDKNHATIPRAIVEEALKRTSKTITYCARNPRYDILLDKQSTYFITSGLDEPYILDWETGERRLATCEDLVRWTRLADYLENVHFLWVTLAASDAPPEIQSLTQLVISLENTEKHVEYEAHNAKEAHYMIEIAETIMGDRDRLKQRPLISAVQSPLSPLVFEKGSIEAAIEFAQAGIPVVYMDMPLAMVTAPATLAGTLVLTNAENLSGLVISEFASPGAPVVYSTCASVVDPASGAPIESGMGNLLVHAAAQMAHYYDIPCELGGCGSMSKALDMQAGYETAMGVNQNIFSGADIICGLGDLEAGLCASAAKLVIDNEIVGEAYKFINNGLEITNDTLALDVICKVGPGGNFLSEKHTLKHCRELIPPQLSDHSPFEVWRNKRYQSIDQVANQKVKEILAKHQPEPLPEHVERNIHEILNHAKRELS